MTEIATKVESEKLKTEVMEALASLKSADVETKEKINKLLDANDARAKTEADAKEAREADSARLDALEQKQIDFEAARSNPTAAGGEAGESDEAAQYKAAHLAYLKGKGLGALDDLQKKTLTRSETSGGNAGFLVPPEYDTQLIALRADISPIRQYAQVVSTERELQKVPIQTGALTAVWVAEGAARSETTGTAFSEIEIKPQVLRAEVRATEETLEDSFFDLGGIMYRQFIDQFARAEGIGFISGSGSGQPRGITTTGDANTLVATGATTETSGTNARKVTFSVINSVVHSLKSSYARNARFCFNRKTLGEIREIENGNGQLIYQPGGTGQTGAPSTIMGHEWFETPDIQSFGTAAQTPMIFGDFQAGYRVLDRLGAIRVKVDEYTAEANGQIKFIARTRVGGSVIDKEALRVVKTG